MSKIILIFFEVLFFFVNFSCYSYGLFERRVTPEEERDIKLFVERYYKDFYKFTYAEQSKLYYKGVVRIVFYNHVPQIQNIDNFVYPTSPERYEEQQKYMKEQLGNCVDYYFDDMVFSPMPFEGSEENVYCIHLETSYEKGRTYETLFLKKDIDYYIWVRRIDFTNEASSFRSVN
jgi:hypothetical protein